MSTTEAPLAAAGSTGDVPTTHPTGFYFFFWGEFAERCSYYGMRAILPLYLTMVLQYPREEATEIYSYFKASVYFLPLLGGFLADRYFGKYWTLVGFSVPYVLGHFILGIENRIAMYIALILLACGSGVTKPNISTLMGLTYDQQRPGQLGLRSAAFLWFYFAVNVGATLSMFALPWIRDAVHKESGDLPLAYRVAFQFPAWFMMGALVVFASGKRFYAVEVIDRTTTTSPEERREQLKVLASLFGIFGLMVFFWMAYEQNDNLWTFFAQDHIDCLVDLGFFRKQFAPDQFQFINGFLILILVPFFGWMWRRIDPAGRHFPPTTKILFGFWWTAVSAAIMALAAQAAAGGEKITYWWIVAAYFALTVGEILVYGTGLELSYAAAPPQMKGFVTACFLLTNTAGNLVNSQVSPLYGKYVEPRYFFAGTAFIVLWASAAVYLVGRRFSGRTTT